LKFFDIVLNLIWLEEKNKKKCLGIAKLDFCKLKKILPFQNTPFQKKQIFKETLKSYNKCKSV